jgi:hypothetical protein
MLAGDYMTNKKFILSATIFSLLVALAVAGRLVPHYPNFTPVAATALFGSFLFGRRIALIIPIAAMLVSDLFIGFYEWKIMVVVYAALAFPVLFGKFLKGKLHPAKIAVSALTSSVVFFASTNFAVWLFSSMYTRGLKGLLECYSAGIPFFRYTLAGDSFWAMVLFSGYALVCYLTEFANHFPMLRWRPADSQ